MDALLYALVGLFGGGTLGFVIACSTGQLVPVSTRDRLQQQFDKQTEAYERVVGAYETLKREVDDKAHIAAITTAVLDGMTRFNEKHLPAGRGESS